MSHVHHDHDHAVHGGPRLHGRAHPHGRAPAAPELSGSLLRASAAARLGVAAAIVAVIWAAAFWAVA